ncbi:ABC transporter substrate-binding protein [Bradyrhizobium sp. AUGA SZCCT0042]|uniref:ABC transporter substrate-binding protein n=1 Tax=Bradyrhizobium sp. AUGA SZCCT0042 TaxID=2807651 RepID=UPI001BA85660|nr:ABC transporter substrate-binding protein [Bradyrhizobium sp. AUGA SZCCT0042]MBR1302215.1 ABC transporter substrate-binding protein [Bradyrhizobium sp. AUGA SZCCT0042]
MRRREFVAGAAVAALALVRQARAQTDRSTPRKRIAIISPARPVEQLKTHPYFRSFLDELSRRGFVEGEHLIVDRYSGGGRTGSYADLARTVVATNPDAIFTSGYPMVAGLKAMTTTVPIVATIDDPVAAGLASSLARPGTNFTGVTVDAGLELYGKRLALLVEARPNVSVVGYLSSSDNWSRPTGAAVREAAQQAKVAITHVDIGNSFNEATYAAAFASMRNARIDALLVSDEPDHNANAKTLTSLAASARIPTMYPFRDLAVAGGLMTYCIDLLDAFRYAAGQVAEILRGKNPAEIPFYQPTKFQLIINTKAAQQIGLDLPPTLVARADEVIE